MKTRISKRVLAVALTVVMLLSAVPVGGFVGLNLFGATASAAYYGVLEYEIENGEVEIIRCDQEASGEVTIPSTIEGRPVTAIGDSAFYYCDSLTSVTIPDGVTSIGSNAFYRCTSLTSINVDENNTIYSSFSGVLFNKDKSTLIQYPIGNERNSYSIPDSVTSIGDWAFYNCSSLTSVTIPDSVTSIDYSAFFDCTSLTSVTIPDSVTSIDQYAFYNCTSLTSVTIPDSVTSIGYNAFSGTGYYSNDDNWENDVLYIGNCLIKAKTEISGDYTINSGTRVIAVCAFYNCTSLTSVTIPDSVTSIGSYAFNNTGYYNDNSNWENDVLYIGNYLIEVKREISGEYTIKPGTRLIAEHAFYNCASLTSVTIPDSVTSIGYGAFDDCSSLTNVTIGNSVTSIGDYAFYYCTSLTSVTIPDSVTSIGDSAFDNDRFLEKITVDENNAYYSSEDGVLFDKNKTALITYPCGKTDEAYEIPNSVESIREETFYLNLHIRKITIPESVKTVEQLAFFICLRLDDIYYYGKETDIDPESWYSYSFTNCDKWLEGRDEFIPLFIKDLNSSITEKEENRLNELIESFGEIDGTPSPQGATVHGYTGSTAEAYANTNGINFVPFFTEATDEETNINTEFDPGVLPEGTVLLIDKKGQNPDSTFNGKYEYYESFDISFVDENNVEIQPNGTVTVRIPVPQTFNPEKTVVYFVAPDGTQTKLNSWHEGRYIVFEVNHFSEYVIVDESSEVTTPDEPDVPDEPEKPSNEKKDFIVLLFEFLTKLFNFLADLFS